LWSVGQGILILLSLLFNGFYETLLQRPEYVEIYVVVLLIVLSVLAVIGIFRKESVPQARKLTLSTINWLTGILGTLLLADASALFLLLGIYNPFSYFVFGLFFSVVVMVIYFIGLSGRVAGDGSKARADTVHVDAKIIGRDDPASPKRTLVGYVVEGSTGLQGVKEVAADETDEAELEAVAFAFRELKEKLPRFTIVCDHESVVLEINRGRTRPRSPPLLSQVQEEMRKNPSIRVIQLAKNPAHALLNSAEAALTIGG
jgi:hypothetical protein